MASNHPDQQAVQDKRSLVAAVFSGIKVFIPAFVSSQAATQRQCEHIFFNGIDHVLWGKKIHAHALTMQRMPTH